LRLIRVRRFQKTRDSNQLKPLWSAAALGCGESPGVPILRRSVIQLFSTLLALFAVGCTVGPNYHRPNVPTAPAWKEQAPWRVSDPKDSIPKGSWWTIFSDPELDKYETQALTANQTIEIARNQLEQARASARITVSGWFPQASTGVSLQRSLTPPSSISSLAGQTQNNLSIPFNVT